MSTNLQSSPLHRSEKLAMTLASDLVAAVKGELATVHVDFDEAGDADYFASLHFEMILRKPPPHPRAVLFSREIHTSLGQLKTSSLEHWRTVFHLRDLLARGEDVTSFLSTSLSTPLSELPKTDGLLLDFGLHHFHLSRVLKPSGRFRERTGPLLFAMIRDTGAYFVDIRHHNPPNWSAQDLLGIVHSNWPALTEQHALRGESGDQVTDEQRVKLRRKNVNVVTEISGRAVAPLGGGVTMAGTSAICRRLGDELLHEIDKHQAYIDSDPPELRAKITANSSAARADAPEFRLRLLSDFRVSPEVLGDLRHPRCLSKRLAELGFLMVESHSQKPVAVRLIEREP